MPPSRRISDYNDINDTSNQQNEEWGVIQEQQPLLSRGSSSLVSLSNSILVSSHGQKQQQQHKENPLLTRLLDGSSSNTRVSIDSGSRLSADRQT